MSTIAATHDVAKKGKQQAVAYFDNSWGYRCPWNSVFTICNVEREVGKSKRLVSLRVAVPFNCNYTLIVMSNSMNGGTPGLANRFFGCNLGIPSQETTAVEGQELYLHFFHEQLRSAGLGDIADQEEARLYEYHDATAHMHDRDTSEEGAASVEAESPAAPVQRRRSRTQSLNLENFQVR